MRVLVTGATGFLGKALLSYIENRGYDKQHEIVLITGKDKVNPRYSCIVHEKHKVSKKEFSKIGHIDAVIHLGGGIPTQSINLPFSDIGKYVGNIDSTYDLLENLPNIPERFVLASSVMVYKPTLKVISENTDIGPVHPYGLSKYFCEKILSCWAEQNQVQLQILRIGQCYGAGEESGLLLPKMIDCALDNEKFMIWSDGSERRSFIHSSDVAKGIWLSLNLDGSHTINLASAKSYSVLELATKVFGIGKKQNLLIIQNGNFQTKNFIYDAAQMHEYLGEEDMDFDKGLRLEFEYRKTLGGVNLRLRFCKNAVFANVGYAWVPLEAKA